VLPIHAAGTYRGGVNVQAASDFMVSSYIPTLSALTTTRKCWKAILREHLDGLIVADPAPGRGWDRIDNVITEADVVQGCFTTAGAPVVRTVDASATVSSVVSDLRTSEIRILHMACHGTQRPNPLQSAFILRDEDLTIQDLMRLDLSHATLAFLSACQTAQGDSELPDQVVHLAASLLFCGFRSVIGTLW
jgi:CHAT domain-containing protein